jgi:hypothetical protein
MTADSDQLAALGQQVVDAITAAYIPREDSAHDDSALALALHPGQPIADHIVQNGVTNELRVTQWLADQYDYPLLLRRAAGTPVDSSIGTVTATSAYATMARFSQPAVGGDDPAYPRLAQLIADARAGIGEHPDALPISCEPTDFAEDGCPAWQTFDSVISTHTSESTDAPPPPPTRGIDPELWKIRTLRADVLTDLPRRRAMRIAVAQASTELTTLPADAVAQRVKAQSVVDAESVVDARSLADVQSVVVLPDAARTSLPFETAAVREAAAHFALAAPDAPAASTVGLSSFRGKAALGGRVADVLHADTLDLVQGDTTTDASPLLVSGRLNTEVAQDLAHVQLADLVAEPSGGTVTTADTSLHVHFEYVMLRLTRRLSGLPWWHSDFVAASQWFVPGMAKGAMVPDAPDADRSYYLPASLLLVRNVRLTGVWSEEARAAMTRSVRYVGPFLMAPPEASVTTSTDAQHMEATTITGLGVQVIGELCTQLPPLPPTGDPALADH